MVSSEPSLPWWDREFDEKTGSPLRPDVREAAHRVWKWVSFKTREILGDPSDAAEVLESSVKSVSRYLDKNNVPLHTADPGGLLAVACYRRLRRLARRRRRIEFVGGSSELADILRVPDWRDKIDRRLFLEELARELDVDNRGILRLRTAGYDWKEIARMLGMSVPAVRQGFWRNVRKAHLRLLRAGHATRSDEWK
jgi:DNA-directed RNA polymerase specialized sigma24 family protein